MFISSFGEPLVSRCPYLTYQPNVSLIIVIAARSMTHLNEMLTSPSA